MSRKIDKSKGYILTWRSDQDDLLYFSEPFSKYAAWLDLNLLANYEEKSFLLGNEIINAEIGSVITSELKLMNRWQWSKEKVRNFLKLLEKLDYIERRPDHKKTVIIIKDYSEYQTAERRLKSMDSSEKPTTIRLNNDCEESNNRLTAICEETMSHTQTNHYKGIEDTNIHNKVTTNINPPISPKGDNTRKQSKENLIKKFKSMVDETELSEILKNKIIEWIDYKSEIKKPYKSEKGFNKFLSILINHTLTHSDQEIINVIDRSMASEYKGIVWDWLEKSNNKPNSNYIDSIHNRVNQVDSWI